jgi:hypothetical protein
MADSPQIQADSPGQTKRRRLPFRLPLLSRRAQPDDAPAWAPARDEARQRVGQHATDIAVGAAAALVVATAGWLLAAALTLAVWATAAPATQSPAMPLRAAGQLWLAAHHILLRTPDGPFGLTPLGFTILPAGALVLAGRYVAWRFGSGLWSLATVAVCYPLAALLIGQTASSGPFYVDKGTTIGYSCLIASCCFGAGLLTEHASRLDNWAVTALRAAASAIGVLVGGSALLAALAVVLRFPEVAGTGDAVGQGLPGDAGLFLVDLALVPNVVVWALSFLSGPGFLVGDGTSVAVTGIAHGVLPGLPLLQAVPAAGPFPVWGYAVFAVPPAAGVAALLIVGRSVRHLAGRAAAMGSAVAAIGLFAAAACTLSGGPVAAGKMSAIGPVPWRVALAVMVETGVAAAAGFGLRYSIEYVHGYVRRPRAPDLGQGVRDRRGGLSGLDDDGAADLVGPRLVLGVPQRGKVADVAGNAVDDVRESADEGHAEAGDLSVRLPHDADPDDLLADGLSGRALPVELEEAEGEHRDVEQRDDGQAESGHAAAGDDTGVRVVSTDTDTGAGDDERDDVDRHQD